MGWGDWAESHVTAQKKVYKLTPVPLWLQFSVGSNKKTEKNKPQLQCALTQIGRSYFQIQLKYILPPPPPFFLSPVVLHSVFAFLIPVLD